jgi:hypothetical protein
LESLSTGKYILAINLILSSVKMKQANLPYIILLSWLCMDLMKIHPGIININPGTALCTREALK